MRLLTPLFILAFGCTLPATTLNFSFVAQEFTTASLTDQPSQSCGPRFSGGTQFPLSCSVDPLGGHGFAAIGGTQLAPGATQISDVFQFQGSAVAAIFQQLGADTKSVTSGYSFQAILSPLNAGDTFKFSISDSETCMNTLGTCSNPGIGIYGASSITGNLSKGETVTAHGPVIIDLSRSVSVSNLVPNWTENDLAKLTITPIRESKSRLEAADIEDPVETPEPRTIALMLSSGLLFVGLKSRKLRNRLM